MNYQEHPNTLKHHQLITILTEVACVCLILASIISGINQSNMEFISVTDSLNHMTNMQDPMDNDISEDEDNKFLAGDKIYIALSGGDKENNPLSGGRIEYTTDENGNIIAGRVEFSTDENGDRYFAGINLEDFKSEEGGIAIWNPNAGDSDSFDKITTPSRDPYDTLGFFFTALSNITSLLSPFLPCVLLMLYVLTLYKKDGMTKLFPWIFGLMSISSALQMVSLLMINNTAGYPFFPLISFVPHIILTALFAVMALQLKAGNLNRKFTLVTAACNLLFFLINLLPTLGSHISTLQTLHEFFYAIGFLAFAGAWFIFAYLNDLTAKTAQATPAEAPAEEPAPTESVEG